MSRPKKKARQTQGRVRESASEVVPRFGPQERSLRVAMDKASVFASEKRHQEGLSKLQMTAVRVTIPAIVTGLAMLDRRRADAKRFMGEMTEYAFRQNEADAALWLLWLDVVRGVFTKQEAEA